MNIVTASFNTAMRQMTEMSHDQMSQQKMTENLRKKNRASEQWCI